MKKTNILILALALLLSETAFAQWGSIGRAIKQEVKQEVKKEVRQSVNNSTVLSDKVSIQRIPASVEEFQALQAELGTTPEGCIMLQLVAMEMYRRDRNVGLECLTLNNTETNLSFVTSRLKEIFREGDSYARPYLVSTYFKGAKPSNGYNPEKPYTIRVRRNPAYPNDERSQSLKGYVKYFQVYSDGYDTAASRWCSRKATPTIVCRTAPTSTSNARKWTLTPPTTGTDWIKKKKQTHVET